MPTVAIGRAINNATAVATGVGKPAYPAFDEKMKAADLASANRALPLGLCSAMARSIKDFPMRIMIVDNSGSMQTADGKKLVRPNGSDQMRAISCSRWQELSAEVMEVASLAATLNTRLDIHMLNASRGFAGMSICTDTWGPPPALGRSGTVDELRRSIAAVSPGGTTPLTESVMHVVSMVEPMKEMLRAAGERIVVIVATDGLPNDQPSFLNAMKALQTLPVWVVVRLCTDDDGTVSYWNDLDAQLEAPLEVLDDVKGEADEIAEFNSWLTYGPALHLARLFGLPGALYDALDEVRLMPSQIKEFIEDVLGCDVLPEPQIDPKAFVTSVKQALAVDAGRGKTWDPRSGRLRPWMDEKKLARALSNHCDKAGCAIM